MDKRSNKVILNTSFLYTKMVITIIISLYTTRIVLESLGSSDYGIYVLVGGIISMLGFLNTTMASSTQRFLSFNLGKNDLNRIRKTFANSIILHFFLGLFLLILFETVGYYLINEKLNISNDRIGTAMILYQLVVFSTFVEVTATPYDGIINAKENMLFLSIVGVFDSLLKLLVALSLFFPYDDKLLIFGIGMFTKSLIVRFLKQFYCFRNYKKECKVNYRKEFDSTNIKELYSFAGWNLIGVLAYVMRNQGVSVVLNLFFTTVLNAAYGVANQVNTQLRMFSSAMLQAVNPSMVKLEGSGDRKSVITLSLITSKFSFYLFVLFALPIYLNLDFLIGLWLIDIPKSTVLFCEIMILTTTIQQFRTGITIATHAIGKIKEFQLLNSPIQLLSLPLGYMFLSFGYPPYSILLVILIIEIVALILNIIFFRRLTDFPISTYLFNVVFKSLACLLISFFVSLLLKGWVSYYLNEFLSFILISIISVTLFLSTIYLYSLNKNEKVIISSLIKKVFIKIKSSKK